MSIGSRFHPRAEGTINFTFEGETIRGHTGDSVATALLAHTGAGTRETAGGTARTAYCMMGACFECLVEIDGHPNCQACMTELSEGMVIRRQQGLRGLGGGNDAGG